MIASKPILPNNATLILLQPGLKRLPDTKSNILLAGANKAEVHKIASYLNGNYNMFITKNACGAMKVIDNHPIHLVITTTSLTDMQGNQFCLHLKSSHQYFHLPVITIIEKNTLLSRMACIESGADAFFETPLSGDILAAQVNNILANRARIKNYFANTFFAHTGYNEQLLTTESFAQKLNQCINENMADPNFDVDLMAKYMNMSRPTLYRKIQRSLKLTPNELINTARLKKAAELLSTSRYQVYEIVKLVGFSSRSNFGKAFLKKFNVTPTGYQQIKKGD